MTTVKVSDAATPSVLVSSTAAGTVLPVSVGAPSVLVQQHEHVVLVQPTPATTAPVELSQDTIIVQDTTSPTALVFDGAAITVQATGGTVEVLPNRTLRGKGALKKYLYVGFSDAAIGSENEAAAQWKIYRYDTVLDTSSFADGDELFDNIWDDRETLTYP
jgi:hypothetical protein